ncbi:tRNA (adenosine(37)-N6)-threonylcarbamoyltransferase complex transferase subunit TsaD [Patescibacteria group bacterium]|nr:tRNA (adenosine(37)-N6)-threonylcarbamoyltransferase complex transferase subunit TsaD [Patescibacteria group bacterium]
MLLLSIETSCDETAISIVEAAGDFPHARYKVLGNALFSQIDIHREYGGVFPLIAKREHIATVVPMLEKAIKEAGLTGAHPHGTRDESLLEDLLTREPGLCHQLLTFHEEHGVPPIDAIGVTNGPGLEPALWVGINFAKALAHLWNVPVIPVNHMEGHILASVFDGSSLANLSFPSVALLVSGGHTELVLMKEWGRYELIGQTRDDAVGEAFDKVARLLGLPYPGGPEISRRADEARKASLPEYISLPRPMLHSGDLDFSFSGLKTAVRYGIAEKSLTDDEVRALARDFEDAAVHVLIAKLTKAVETHGAASVILGGGVAANARLRESISALGTTLAFPHLQVHLPSIALSTDNSVMIALAAHAHLSSSLTPIGARELRAQGNKSLS